MKSVTRLYTLFQPDHYDLHITPDQKAMHFSGKVIITGKKTGRPSQRLTFHQHGLRVTSAVIKKIDKKGTQNIQIARINHHKSLQEVRLHSEQMMYPGKYRVELEFDAPITKGMTGLYPCFFKHNGKEHTLIATQFESHHAREVFPSIDEPEAKATFDLHITAEAGLTVLGNTPIANQKSHDNLVTTTFETSPRMSSYLLAFVIGELHNRSTKTSRGTEVKIWASIAQPTNSFEFALDVAKRSIEFFEEYFDMPYPLSKADHVALPDFSSGAMENWGLITYREVALLLYPEASSQSAKEMIATVIAHETSHQWFGNLVTMQWWDDLWLNESFANMMEYVAVDALFPDWNIWESFVTAEGLSATRRDSTPGVQAVKATVRHPDEISTLFDPSIVYAKGGRLLYMLKNYIGEESFRAGLQSYFKIYAFNNTTGSDLWKSLSEASGKDIASFMNPWLERSGFPVVSVNQTNNQIKISQEHFLDSPDKSDKNRLWPIPLFSNIDAVPTLLKDRDVTIHLADSSWATVNTGSQGHYIVNYLSPEHRKFIAGKIASVEFDTINRLGFLSDSAMLARAGYQHFGDTLELLNAYRNESSESVWDIMSLIIADAKRFIDYDERIEAELKSLVSALITNEYQRLGWDERQVDSTADQKLRATILGLGVYSEKPEIITEALDKFDAYQKDSSAVSAELRGIVFSAAVKTEKPQAADYLLKLYSETNNGDLQRDITGGLTATKSPENASALLNLVKNEKVVKPQDADRWLIYLLRNRHTRDIAWDWMESNWQWIVDTYKNDKSYDNFPRYAAIVCGTRQWENRYKTFFGPKTDETVLKRNIAIGFEEISSRISWLKRDVSSVRKYFKLQ